MKSIFLFLLLTVGTINAAQQTIGVGTTPNDGTGDTLRAAMVKANSNFTELYTRAFDSDITLWAGITPSADGASLVAADFAAMKVLLELETGSDFLSPAAIAAAYQPLEATLTDIADGTITENLVNTANPWADNEVADSITVTGSVASGTLVASGFNGNLATTDDTMQEIAQKLDDLSVGSGAVATDTIWNAAGDLVYGTGSDTASRLAIGTAGQVLQVNTGATAPEWSSTIDVTTVDATSLEIGGVAVTSTAAELNILDGVTSTAAELNILDGVTSTAAELNIVDGVTSTAAELNALDGITSTVTELNYTDGVTSAIQTQLDAKAAKAIVTKTVTGAYTVGTTDANELYGGVLYVTSAATVTIPAVAAGASFTVITIGAIAVSVDPNASDLIYLDGTALSDGDKVTNTSTAGDIAVFTYYDATGWYCSSNTWTDGN